MMPAIKKRYEMYAEYQDMLMSKRNREINKKNLVNKKVQSPTAVSNPSYRNSPDPNSENQVS